MIGGDKLDGETLAQTVSRTLNSFCHDETIKEFVDAMVRDHRTLQQTFTKLCVEWFKALAEDHDNNRYDARNEASCKLAKLIVELGVDKLAMPFI
jgi:hypothetical protein